MKTLLMAVLVCVCSTKFVNVAIAADSSCGPNPSVGTWQKGITNKVDVADISKEIPDRYKEVVRYLEKLPIDTSEKTLVAGVRFPLSDTTRLWEDSPLFTWKISEQDSLTVIRVFYWKRCIGEISFQAIPGERYSRKTNFDKSFTARH